MTVGELHEELTRLLELRPELADEQVYSSSDYGDFGHNEQAIRVECLVWTAVSNGPHAQAYSQQGLEVVQFDDMEDEPLSQGDPGPDCAVVLGYRPKHEYWDAEDGC